MSSDRLFIRRVCRRGQSGGQSAGGPSLIKISRPPGATEKAREPHEPALPASKRLERASSGRLAPNRGKIVTKYVIYCTSVCRSVRVT